MSWGDQAPKEWAAPTSAICFDEPNADAFCAIPIACTFERRCYRVPVGQEKPHDQALRITASRNGDAKFVGKTNDNVASTMLRSGQVERDRILEVRVFLAGRTGPDRIDVDTIASRDSAKAVVLDAGERSAFVRGRTTSPWIGHHADIAVAFAHEHRATCKRTGLTGRSIVVGALHSTAWIFAFNGFSVAIANGPRGWAVALEEVLAYANRTRVTRARSINTNAVGAGIGRRAGPT